MKCQHCLFGGEAEADGTCPVCGSVICTPRQIKKRGTLRWLSAAKRRWTSRREARANHFSVWRIRTARAYACWRRNWSTITVSVGFALFIAILLATSTTGWKRAFGRGDTLDAELVSESVRGDPRRIRSLVARGADVDALAPRHVLSRPICAAARLGKVESLKALIEAGADVNLPDFLGKTAVMYAIERGDVRCVGLLRIAGAVDSSEGPR